mmetsp:Transcript_13465/g.12183  ORF Transcript_13465/g.12183 Transcript_13465/m.12183 type:complete len:141 (+) Transcript_13465:51-473(+)
MNATRRRISRSGSPYSKLSTDDELDSNNSSSQDINIPPQLFVHQPIRINIPKSTTCPKLLVVFNISGILFLSTIAYMLGSNSLYLKVDATYEHKKPELLFGVIGAIGIHILCLLIGITMWCKTSCEVNIDNNRPKPMIIQ